MNPDKKGAYDPGTAFIPIDGKAPAQRAGHGGSLAKKHNCRFICAAMRGREAKQDVDGKATCKGNEKKETQQQGTYMQQLELRKDGKTNCLTSIQKDNLIIRLGGGYDKGEAYENKTPALPNCPQQQNNVLPERAERIRRLTPLECARLQTIPSWYKWEGTSDTRIYKMLGNGWTVDAIVHILGFMNMNRVPAKKCLKRHLDKKCRKKKPSDL